MTTVLFGFLILLSATVLAVVGLILVQRLVPLPLRESHNTAIGIVYAALYVMFGVMVGFTAYLVLNKYTTSQNAARTEAANVEQLYWLAEELPEPKGDEIQELTVSYTRAVIDEDGPC